MDAGIQIVPAMPGQVPEIECREAAVYTGVTWREWTTLLTAYDREYAVAHYRMHLLIEAHVNDAAQKRSRSDQARASRRGAGRGGRG